MRLLYLLALIFLFAAVSETEIDIIANSKTISHLTLFPDQTKNIPSSNQRKNPDSQRTLSFENDPYTAPVLCSICSGLTVCNILNGLLVQEVYYPQGDKYICMYVCIHIYIHTIYISLFVYGKYLFMYLCAFVHIVKISPIFMCVKKVYMCLYIYILYK